MMTAENNKKRILILGGGFGGLHAALRFERELKSHQTFEVTLISPDNYSLFTPMLHEVATAELDPASIVVPMHKLLRRVKFVAGRVSTIDTDEKKVSVRQTARLEIEDEGEREVAYDYLLLALGSTTNFFDLPGIEANSLTMKTLTDALVLRNAVIGSLEAASIETDAKEKARLLTFAVAGGGFAGIETVGAINDFARGAIRHYPNLDEKQLRVALIHASSELLPEFRGELSRYTGEKLVERGVEVRLKTSVAAASFREITIEGGETMPVGVFVWTAGVKPDKLIANLPFQKEKGRLLTDEFLQLPAAENIWAIGDCAAIPDKENGGFYAPLAQNAQRQGAGAAVNILAAIGENADEKQAFRYRTLGQLATIGYHSGVANVLDFRFSGFFAWLLWRGTYVYKLPTFEKKLRVLSNWLFDAIFSRDVVQFISMDSLRSVEERKQMMLDWRETESVNNFPAPAVAKSSVVFQK
jgi:NADH dehydrogenase